MRDKIGSWWKGKNKNEKRKSILGCVIVTLFVVYLVLSLFSKQIFGADSRFTKSAGRVVNLVDDVAMYVEKLLMSLAYIAIVLVIYKIIIAIISRIIKKMKRGYAAINLVRSFVKYATGIILICLVLSAWGVKTVTLLAGAGILGLVIGLGAQSLVEDILAGLFIVFEKTYDIGDVITVGDFRGTVKEIGIRTTKILSGGGDVKIVNNSDMRSITNLTTELSIAVSDINIDYNQSLEEVEKIIAKNMDDIKVNIPAIIQGPFYKGVAALAESGVTLRFLCKCEEKDRFQTVRDLNRQLKLMFDKNNISIPFNQVVVHQAAVIVGDENKKII